MKPLIGVVLRPSINKTNRKMFGIYNKINRALREDARVIGVVSPTQKKLKKKYKKDIIETLKLLDGIVLQGGDDITSFELFITKHVYENNIPTIGICLGMQTMSYYKKGKIKKINTKNHNQKNKDYVHEIDIDKNSKLYEIIKKGKMKVNSRHNDMVINTELSVSAISDDDVIEAVEDKNKDFFIGFQWHPEDMITYDKVNKKIFKYFIKVCKEKSYGNRKAIKYNKRKNIK